MHIINIGYNHSHDADFNISRPNGSGNYLLLLLKTPAIFTLNGSEIITRPDSFILYREDTPQFYRSFGSQFQNDWFHFKIDPEEKDLFNNLGIPQDEVVHIGNLNELSIIINNLCYETYSSNRYKYDTIELYLKLFFLKLSNKIHNSNNEIINTHYNKLSIIRTKIYNQPYINWNITELSHELNMSRSSFQHLYKKLFGISAITDVILSRIEHAKYLLSTTDIPIKKISEMCGYNNDIHFMRQFKKVTELTPTKYREEKNNEIKIQ
ncbi:AraC family transcriptional regulator [Clostridium intestinale]|uniref:AraC family transcriptional regulator, arabinose operon regulatory protein n=1 Tax=Clostridium intestinale DSM 6191 TaxID=1121320 RepID=A0A1M5YLL5_9CLOT|nr:AraC family transcriptional regulator [Clostridium intestinale]SHI12788.1 AraC family transcriptional regulator, arabinose operon regulatory protein [Clostridium intestinale DSM 6191]